MNVNIEIGSHEPTKSGGKYWGTISPVSNTQQRTVPNMEGNLSPSLPKNAIKVLEPSGQARHGKRAKFQLDPHDTPI